MNKMIIFVMTEIVADEALDAIVRLGGVKEQDRFLKFLDRIDIIPNDPSTRAINLTTTRKV